MSIEHDQPEDHVPPPPNSDDLQPLSSFFPEVTEEEARCIDGETTVIMERRVLIMQLYRQRNSMRAIAERVKCSLNTVHRDIHTVLAGYRRLAARSAQEHIADCLQRLSAREIDIEAEWDKSKGERIETHAENRNGNSTAKLKKKQAYGDPRLAQLLLQCWDRRCKLLGLLAAGDLSGKDGMPPVKIVAGLDPVEVV